MAKFFFNAATFPTSGTSALAPADPLGALAADCADAAASGAVQASLWLAEADSPEEPIVRGLFDAGDRVTIVGQSKARKSFFALQMAVSIATGGEFLGFDAEQRRVLLYNGEIRAAPYKKRLRRMVEQMRVDPGSLADLRIVNAADDSASATFETIRAEASRIGAQVVIADPAYLLIDGDESDQHAVKAAVRAMKLFSSAGITLVMVYHAAKGFIGDRQVIDRVSGSAIFGRDASTMITMCEHADTPDCVVVQTVVRNHPPIAPSTIRFTEGAFELAEGVAAVEKTSRTRTRRVVTPEEIKAAFNGAEPQSYGSAVAMVKGRFNVGMNAAKDVIGQAVQSNILSTRREGRSVIYELKP